MQQDRLMLSVIVPAYNEQETIEAILTRISDTGVAGEVIVIDDASTDETVAAVMRFARAHPELPLKLAVHSMNFGKARAVQTGFKLVEGDAVILQDADLEYDPCDYSRLLELIREGKADVVYGSRFRDAPRGRFLSWQWVHCFGNRFLTLLSNFATGLHLTDMETCYKMMRVELVRRIEICATRFGIEPEITAKLARCGARIKEVPISYRARSYSEGKKIGFTDFLAALWWILRFSMR